MFVHACMHILIQNSLYMSVLISYWIHQSWPNSQMRIRVYVYRLQPFFHAVHLDFLDTWHMYAIGFVCQNISCWDWILHIFGASMIVSLESLCLISIFMDFHADLRSAAQILSSQTYDKTTPPAPAQPPIPNLFSKPKYCLCACKLSRVDLPQTNQVWPCSFTHDWTSNGASLAGLNHMYMPVHSHPWWSHSNGGPCSVCQVCHYTPVETLLPEPAVSLRSAALQIPQQRSLSWLRYSWKMRDDSIKWQHLFGQTVCGKCGLHTFRFWEQEILCEGLKTPHPASIYSMWFLAYVNMHSTFV